MRFVLFLLGVVLGVAGTLAYGLFVHPEPSVPAARPVLAEAPLTITLGERFLTGVVQRAALDAPRGVDVPPANLRVTPRDGVLELHAAVEVLGNTTSGQAILRPVLRDGRLVMDVVETNLGAFPIAAVEKVLEQQINARIGSLLAGMPVTFTGVRVDAARGLTLTCEVDLDAIAGPPRS
jgi:hypothetical protein